MGVVCVRWFLGVVGMVLMVTGDGVMRVKCWGLVFNVVYFGGGGLRNK